MFNAINHILYEKPSVEMDAEILGSFVPYLTRRYYSFHSPDHVNYINDTLNIYSSVFDTLEGEFRFFEHCVPNLKKKKIPYVKKPKDKEEDDISHVPEFYSKREIRMMNN